MTVLRVAFSSVLLLAVLAAPAVAQRKSAVDPKINDSFKNPNVADFVERFEREGREIYDKREQVVAACGVREGMAVADVGAGTGLFSRLFARQTGPQGKVYAVDIAKNFVEHIVKSSQEEGLSNVVGITCKADSSELPANSVDLVFICDTYHHFEHPESTMKSIHQALRPGGILCVIDFQRIEGVSSEWILNHVRAGKELVTKEIEDIGFELTDELNDMFQDNYFLKFRKR
ncbi:MAG: class I SAM-dependent methyltransferase [Pirellulaceae bacterium]|jgi:ubiquinone/menaquinone biosynthesis C-methylase UbiE|nr:class I SAM-dependent methyltransferase [Pirellulaceae bacterium]